MNGVKLLVCAALAWAASMTSLAADDLSGQARLIDGDTLEIGGQAVRLADIDAPETGQRCQDGNRTYRCGEKALEALSALIAGQSVTCAGDETDRYGRLIAHCRAGARDLNREMVRLGWAVAYVRYSDAYLREEIEALKARRGVWRGPFQRPTDYRAARWESAAQISPEGCPIKGNISRNGRIYHAPWSRHYARTRIDTSKGERWFCSEDEAQAAGWRAPIR